MIVGTGGAARAHESGAGGVYAGRSGDMHVRDLKTMVMAWLLVGCGGGGGAGDASDGSTGGGTGSAGTEPTEGGTGGETTVGVTADPTDGVIGAITVCGLPEPLFVSDSFAATTIAVDPAGTGLYLTVGDKAYRWDIGGGADCGLTADDSYKPLIDGVVSDLAVTVDQLVYASIENSSFSPQRIWPQADAELCLLGPDDGLGAQSISVRGDGTGVVAGGTDAEYRTQLYGLAADPNMCTLELLWTESGVNDLGYKVFVMDAAGRMHGLGLDRGDEDLPQVMVVLGDDGAMVKSYGPGKSLCTASTVARCGADICVVSCTDLYRFSSEGDVLGSVDLADVFDDFSAQYLGIAGTQDETIYVLKVAGEAQAEGYALSVLRFAG